MTGAQNGHVRGGCANPIPEMELDSMELPDGERAAALECLDAARARRSSHVPALDPDMVQAVFTAYLRGWADRRWHEMRARMAEERAAMDGPAEALGDGCQVTSGVVYVAVESWVPDDPPTIGRRA